MSRHLIIHYGEIALKGHNRVFFEKKLAENIQEKLPLLNVERQPGRFICPLPSEEKLPLAKIRDALSKTFGIANFAFAWQGEKNIGRLGQEIADKILSLKVKNLRTFRVTTKRGDKTFPLTSQQINEQLGEIIIKKTGLKVALEKPQLTAFIEILKKGNFFFFEKLPGPGGLPVGSSGRVLSLISSGIDSPVASWYALKRGCRVIFCHFHSFPITSVASQENVKELVNTLSTWQGASKLYFVPLADIQRKIISWARPSYRIIILRRLMVKMANIISEKEGAVALVSGENLGQVASQTIQNMRVVEQASERIILRPLLGFDKQEIIQKAKELGTWEISVRPYEDCCQLFTPPYPETRASLKEILKQEEKCRLEKDIEKIFKKIRVYRAGP